MRRLLALFAISTHALAVAAAEPATKNGFVLDRTSVPLEEILAGGPTRDGIAALVDPPMIPASEATLDPDAWVVGVAIGKEAGGVR